jgi:hypothetical protein
VLLVLQLGCAAETFMLWLLLTMPATQAGSSTSSTWHRTWRM